MVAYASYQHGSAWLGKEFGEKLAVKYFNEQTVASLPRNSKGKNAGNHKATIEWVKVANGGWVKGHGTSGHVERRVGKIVAAQLVIRPWGGGKAEILAQYGDNGLLLD